jgi:hypothetical protein
MLLRGDPAFSSARSLCAGSRREDRRPIASRLLRAMNLSVVAGRSPRFQSGERRFQARRLRSECLYGAPRPFCVRARLQPCRKTRRRNKASAAEGGSPRLQVGGAALSSGAIRFARKTGFSPGLFRWWELQLPRKVRFCAALGGRSFSSDISPTTAPVIPIVATRLFPPHVLCAPGRGVRNLSSVLLSGCVRAADSGRAGALRGFGWERAALPVRLAREARSREKSSPACRLE